MSRWVTSAPWGQLCAVPEVQTLEAEGLGPRAAFRPIPVGLGLWTPWPGPGASQLILRGHLAARAVSPAPRFPVSPSGGSPEQLPRLSA